MVVLALVTGGERPARAGNDPRLKWESIETPHFRVSYYSGEREIAERIADHAEAIYGRMVPAIGWPPSERVELSITDQTDSANAFASALPYDSIRFFATAPDELSPLGDVDDWYEELVTHEFTHVLHTDHIRGVPAIVNVLLGKTLAPNQIQPRWLLEGLAVYEETTRTSGGRLRSSIWNMFMRADVLEDNVAPLDVFSSNVRRWPQGNLWYLYGSFFMRWIAETYGEEAIRAMIDDYGRQLVPYAVNRSIRRATGRTFEELYPAWVATMRRDYGAEADAIRARGLREGKRLTHGGQTAQAPRFIPKNAWPGAEGDLLYYRDDGRSTPGLYRVPIVRDASGAIKEAKERDRELLVRTNGASDSSFLPDGSIVFNSVDILDDLFSFDDLFVLAHGDKSAVGLDGARTRLTRGFRATAPDVSPDGRRVAFVSNTRGTSYLQIADLDDGKLEHVHALVPSEPFDQAFSPRFSPDNVHVAYSVWKKGGFRDIRIVDSRDGSFEAITNDRAIDSGPAFSPDGKVLYFHSDRTGVMNVYAYELATKRLRQVTNTITGALQPAISRDGKTLYYTGYTHDGFDIFGMAIDESRELDALPYVDSRPPPQPEPPHVEHESKPYNPLRTLRPRKYTISSAPGNFGQAFSIGVSGSDIAGHHSLAASLTVETENSDPQFNVGYAYGRLPFDVNANVYRVISPGGGYSVGNYKPAYVEEAVGVSTGIAYALPRAFDGQNVSITVNLARTGANLPADPKRLDPYDTPQIPSRFFTSMVSLSWSYSNAQRFLWSVGPEKGMSAGANLDLTHPTIGSDYRGFRASAGIAGYLLMPWLRHHTVALHVGAGTSGGSFPGSPFYVGGFVDVPFSSTVQTLLQQGAFLQQGGVVLRGYPSAVELGASYALINAEYRFPIVNVDRGLSTLPVMLNRLSGNVFVDYGSAFDTAETAQFKTGVGAELWGDFTLGYFVGFTMRLGYARGLASQGTDKVYVVAAVPY